MYTDHLKVKIIQEYHDNYKTTHKKCDVSKLTSISRRFRSEETYQNITVCV